jgi:hypothetical protein
MTLLLDACPLCRSTLRGGEQQCPSCGADLKPYLGAQARVQELVRLARQLLSQGETDRAASLIPRLSQLASLPPATLLELRGQLALLQGDTAAAVALAGQLGTEHSAGERLREQSRQLDEQRLRARELYNSALAEARSGRYPAAAAQLATAAELTPADPRIWQLKLKADLKARLFSRCYADLAALDRLGARPLEFARLETLLPAASSAA